MLPAILGLGGLTAKIIATAVIPRIVRAISYSLLTTRPAEPCSPSHVEGISTWDEPALAPQRSGVSGSLASSRKWGYAGLWHHGPSGLDLATYRAYDAANRRWISRDPLGEGVDYNLYRYCGNNPVSNVDPLGYAALNVQISPPVGGVYDGGPFKGQPNVIVAGQITNYNNGTVLPFPPSNDRFRKVKVRIALRARRFLK